ncbi:MAG: hypothetical protein NVS9B7_05460 [Flavisolibacter sp.]
MKIFLPKAFLSFLLIAGSLTAANSQSKNVLDPTDTLVTYDSTHKPVQPPVGQIGKWVRTVRVNWKSDMYKAYIYNGAAFRLRYPKSYNPTAVDGKKYPILVFFHGYGERDSIYDNEFQLYHGADFFNSSIENGTYDGYVLMMQSKGYWGKDYYDKIQDILNYMITNNKVDPFQIMANGLSAGGAGVWESLINYPSLYCVGIPLSWSSVYYQVPSVVNTLKYTPMWLFQGGQDINPAPYTTHQVRDSFLIAGADLKYTEIPYAGHNTWDPAWNNMDFFPFLNRTYSSNPYTLYGKTQFFTTDTIRATLGIAPGYSAYQWRKDGILRPDTSNSITVNQLGVYDARVQRNGLWSDWSRLPVTLKMAVVTKIPAQIRAENYAVMSGIKTEPTTDTGGGNDVGYIDNGDWMDYHIHVDTAGPYVFNYRIATPYSDGQFQVRSFNRTVLGTINVPTTGGWQTWQTVSDTITLPAGDQTLRILATGSYGWNINWFSISKAGIIPVAPPPPPPALTYIALPAQIKASDFTAKNNVQTEPTSDIGGGLDVGYINAGSWMEYRVHTADTATYTIAFRLAAPGANGQIQILKASGAVLNTVNVPQTGGWQTWQTTSATVKLDSGDQVIRIFAVSPGWNINWMNFTKGGVAPPPTPTPTPTPTPAPTGSYVLIPATIRAETYVAMNGVQTEPTTDIGGGNDVGYINPGSWMDYNIQVPDTGAYTVNIRLASPISSAQFQFRKADGSIINTVNVPNTGGWQNWQTTSTVFRLDTGKQTIRIYSLTSSWNINWFSFSKGGVISPQPQPLPLNAFILLPDTIKAEKYTAMSGVQKEPTSDIGGGLDVGYINPGSWMDYNVRPSIKGTYTFSLRLASPTGTAQLQLRKSDGTVLSTISPPNTGGWQNWQTVSTTVSLDTGNQVLRIYAVTGGWNINWFSFTNPIAAPLVGISYRPNITTSEVSVRGHLLFPNPARDELHLELGNVYRGKVTIQVVNMNGRLEKQFAVWKRSEAAEIMTINISGLNRGQHLLRMVMDGKIETIKFLKL